MVPGPKAHKKTKHQSCVLMNLSRYVWDQLFQDHACPFIGNGKILKKFRKGDSVCLGLGGGDSSHSVSHRLDGERLVARC